MTNDKVNTVSMDIAINGVAKAISETLPTIMSKLEAICLRAFEAALISLSLLATLEYIRRSPLMTNDNVNTVINDTMTNGVAKLISETLPTMASKLDAICLRTFEAVLISPSLLATLEYMWRRPLITNDSATTVIIDTITNGVAKLISETLPTMASKLEVSCWITFDVVLMLPSLSAIIEYTPKIPLMVIFKATVVSMDNTTNGVAKLISEIPPTMVSKLEVN
jgi:hypothetical protein